MRIETLALVLPSAIIKKEFHSKLHDRNFMHGLREKASWCARRITPMPCLTRLVLGGHDCGFLEVDQEDLIKSRLGPIILPVLRRWIVRGEELEGEFYTEPKAFLL